ncbi:MAG: serine hydrolase, partial [Planctomycetota bacterium]
SPVTLHTLATLMISQSDNTATDHLLFLLGRERVEEMVTKMGNQHAERNVPFLSTLELFKLKGAQQKDLRKRYISGDAAARRAILTKEVAAIDKKDVDLSGFTVKPVAIESLEWYASPADLARMMRWLLDHTKTPETALGRGVLSVNLGLDVHRDKFGFVGFKGGSETGVINLTHVFETKSGDRYVTAATWNNPKAPVDDAAFVAIVQGVIEILMKRVEK